jgi:hypothetical protein
MQKKRTDVFMPNRLQDDIDEFNKAADSAAKIYGNTLMNNKELYKKSFEILEKVMSAKILKSTEIVLNSYLIMSSELVVDSALNKDLKFYIDEALSKYVKKCLEIMHFVLGRMSDTYHEMYKGGDADISSNIILVQNQVDQCANFMGNYLKYISKDDFKPSKAMKAAAKGFVAAADSIESAIKPLPRGLRHDIRRLRNRVGKEVKANWAAIPS